MQLRSKKITDFLVLNKLADFACSKQYFVCPMNIVLPQTIEVLVLLDRNTNVFLLQEIEGNVFIKS